MLFSEEGYDFYSFIFYLQHVKFHSLVSAISKDTLFHCSINSFYCLLETLFGPALPLYYPAKRSGILSLFFLFIYLIFVQLLIPSIHADFGAMYLKDPLEEINEAKVLL